MTASENGVLEPVAALAGRSVQRVAAGGAHSCALLDDHSVLCWGQNDSGQLGAGDRLPRGGAAFTPETQLRPIELGQNRQTVALALGARHSCARLPGGRVKCWGANEFGQLGLGDTRPRGRDPDEMAELPEVALGEDAAAVALSAGGQFTCALLGGGEVKCWGRNELGQLGVGDMSNRGDQPGETGEALPSVSLPLGRRALAISAGYAHACALLDDGGLVCWGSKGGFRLGTDQNESQGDEREELLPVNLGARKALAVSAGGNHTCALLDDRQVLCWGVNWSGALGVGSMALSKASDATAVDLGVLNGEPLLASEVRTGLDFSCALLEIGRIKCWGLNSSGQLGLFDSKNRGDEQGEMGDALPAVALEE
jgi:alpha-tubulin suppressor-like RCC1 family protein